MLQDTGAMSVGTTFITARLIKINDMGAGAAQTKLKKPALLLFLQSTVSS